MSRWKKEEEVTYDHILPAEPEPYWHDLPPAFDSGNQFAVEEAQRRRLEDMRHELIAQGMESGWDPERIDAILERGGLRPYTSAFDVESVLRVQRSDRVRAGSMSEAQDMVRAKIVAEDVPGLLSIDSIVAVQAPETPVEGV